MKAKSPLRKRKTKAVLLAVVLLLIIGTIFYSLVEKLSIIDSLYFSTITLTTVGYGDISPVTTAGKLFTVVYVFLGIGIFLSLISILAEHAQRNYFEQTEDYMNKFTGNIKNLLDKESK